MQQLARYENARQALIDAGTVDEVKDIRDKAEAMRVYAKQAEDFDLMNFAAEIRIRAERRLGEMLSDMDMNKGKLKQGNDLPQSRDATTEPPTLSDMGISKSMSSRAQQTAAIPEEVFEAAIETQKKTAGKELTSSTILRVAAKERREEQKAQMDEEPLPKQKYRVIYADPPWNYGDKRDGVRGYTSAADHYPPMTIKELCTHPVIDICADDAVLFLWTTSPLLFECFPIIAAWGFKYKTSFVWDKVKHNVGHYNSVRHEFLLICTRGSCLPDVKKLHDSVMEIERSDKHSEKPEQFRRIIDEIYPDGRRIELFRRGGAPDGWDVWGHEAA